MAERVSAALRRLVRERARGRCESCATQLAFSGENFSVEHIIPQSRGGNSTPDNLALACQGCNNHKFIRTEAFDEMTGRMTRLFHRARIVGRITSSGARTPRKSWV